LSTDGTKIQILYVSVHRIPRKEIRNDNIVQVCSKKNSDIGERKVTAISVQPNLQDLILATIRDGRSDFIYETSGRRQSDNPLETARSSPGDRPAVRGGENPPGYELGWVISRGLSAKNR